MKVMHCMVFTIFSDAHFEVCHDHTACEHLQILVAASERDWYGSSKRELIQSMTKQSCAMENQLSVEHMHTKCFVKL